MSDAALPRPRKRSRRHRLMMLARRGHLYAGLFMLPWVLLYGVTGALFNHANLLPSGTVAHSSLAALGLPHDAPLANPQALTQDVVAALRDALSDGPAITLLGDGSPSIRTT